MTTGAWIMAALCVGVGVYWYEETKAAASPALPSPKFRPSTVNAARALFSDLASGGGCSAIVAVPDSTVLVFQNSFASDPEGDVGMVLTGAYDEPTSLALAMVLPNQPVLGHCS